MGYAIKTGDTVRHTPTGETWLVAFSEHGSLCPCGWPQIYAKTDDCTLIKNGTPKEEHDLLVEMSEMPDYDPRRTYAKKQLRLLE